MTNDALVTGAPNLVRLLSAGPGTTGVNEDRARGTLLGLAAGNLLGLPVEFSTAADIALEYPNGVTEIDPQERSRPMDDDLAQAVELAEALVEGGDLADSLAQRLIRWRRENGRGIGYTTSDVIDLLEAGNLPPEAARRNYESNPIAPNGGVMRCAPVALARLNDPEGLVRDSVATCAVTHYAPTCQWSCIIINAVISRLAKGVEPSVGDVVGEALEDGAPAEVGEWASEVGEGIDSLRWNHRHIGHTLLCMQFGLWAAQTPLGFEDALVAVIGAGGDTDTNGAVAGAVLGARYGAGAIPQRWLDCIPQRERLESLALDLVKAGG